MVIESQPISCCHNFVPDNSTTTAPIILIYSNNYLTTILTIDYQQAQQRARRICALTMITSTTFHYSHPSASPTTIEPLNILHEEINKNNFNNAFDCMMHHDRREWKTHQSPRTIHQRIASITRTRLNHMHRHGILRAITEN